MTKLEERHEGGIGGIQKSPQELHKGVGADARKDEA